MPEYNISEDIAYDLSIPLTETTFELTNTAYDIVIDDLPFVVKVDNQNPYRRETAPYKKDQFDNSPEPGEQSLTGWWLRSQTSWHNGSGITFYEPGTDFQTVANRFADSRGVDVWTIGEATLLPEVIDVYNSANLITTATGKDGTDVLVSADNVGGLSKISFSGDTSATVSAYTIASHTAYPFTSVTTDGTNYYATCGRAIHVGPIGSNSDVFAFKFSLTNLTNTFIKYVKGSILLGLGKTIYDMSSSVSAVSSETHTSAAINTLPTTTLKTHLNSSWVWNDATASPGPIYISGNAGNNGEVWQISFDEATNAIDLPGAQQVLSLPDGETINRIHYYLGVLALGTSKGLRICPINVNNQIVLGPLLYEASAINGFTVAGNYIYAATTINNEAATYTHGCLVRVDLSTQFNDGTYAYAYDLEYRSSLNTSPISSEATDVQKIGDRIVMVIKQAGYNGLRIESTTAKRNTGFLTTGKIRYGMIEPKFFRYINVQCTTGQGDTIQVYSINKVGTESLIASLSEGTSNQDVYIVNPSTKQEWISFKFVFNNVTDDQDLPVLEAYQVKATPATRRQRFYQYPLSCYDNEMDRFNSVFGYSGRALEYLQRIETIEETGKFVNVTDYRTGEQYSGVIEEVRFINESSPDKDSSGFGGLLLVTVRKL
jgi:hypothetical protein